MVTTVPVANSPRLLTPARESNRVIAVVLIVSMLPSEVWIVKLPLKALLVFVVETLWTTPESCSISPKPVFRLGVDGVA